MSLYYNVAEKREYIFLVVGFDWGNDDADDDDDDEPGKVKTWLPASS